MKAKPKKSRVPKKIWLVFDNDGSGPAKAWVPAIAFPTRKAARADAESPHPKTGTGDVVVGPYILAERDAR